jgi:hypothetical protein
VGGAECERQRDAEYSIGGSGLPDAAAAKLNAKQNVNRLGSILATVVMGGLAVLLFAQCEGLAKLREENKSLRGQLQQLTQAQSERDAVANSQTTANDLSESQAAELLKLRGEVTQLRERTSDIAALREKNDALLASIKTRSAHTAALEGEKKKKSPEDALPQDIHPKDSWGYRGYNTPEATVESMLWAAYKGDKDGFMAGFTPEMQEAFKEDFAQKDFAAEVAKSAIQEFRILDRQTVSDDEMIMTVYTSRDENGNTKGSSDDTHFKKINGQWKVVTE